MLFESPTLETRFRQHFFGVHFQRNKYFLGVFSLATLALTVYCIIVAVTGLPNFFVRFEGDNEGVAEYSLIAYSGLWFLTSFSGFIFYLRNDEYDLWHWKAGQIFTLGWSLTSIMFDLLISLIPTLSPVNPLYVDVGGKTTFKRNMVSCPAHLIGLTHALLYLYLRFANESFSFPLLFSNS